jgi:hypothetical protein
MNGIEQPRLKTDLLLTSSRIELLSFEKIAKTRDLGLEFAVAGRYLHCRGPGPVAVHLSWSEPGQTSRTMDAPRQIGSAVAGA